jgi:hypothetical protein
MPVTYEPIATTTVSVQSTITFSSIPSTYTDLKLVWVGTVSLNGGVQVKLNSDAGGNYSLTLLSGDGSTAASVSSGSENKLYLAGYQAGTSSTVPTTATMDIFSYAGSTYKTCLVSYSGDLNGSGYVERSVQLWRSTSAVNSLTMFNTGSGRNLTGTATLYGIKAA